MIDQTYKIICFDSDYLDSKEYIVYASSPFRVKQLAKEKYLTDESIIFIYHPVISIQIHRNDSPWGFMASYCGKDLKINLRDDRLYKPGKAPLEKYN